MRRTQSDIALLFEVLAYLLEGIRHFSSIWYRVLEDFMQAAWGVDSQQAMAGKPHGKRDSPDLRKDQARSHVSAGDFVLDISKADYVAESRQTERVVELVF